MEKYDFSGWATKNDVRCSDGRTIRRNAFADCDGKTVPLVWMHGHDTLTNVLGHALLDNRKEGVYAYCYLNNTLEGKHAREMIKNGDVNSLSIYANHLKHNGGDVIHGKINEVSLVLAPANPEAIIDTVLIHGDESDDEAVASFGELFELYHSDEEEEYMEDEVEEMDIDDAVEVFNDLTEEQRQAVQTLIDAAYGEDDEEDEEDEYDEEEYGEYEDDEFSHADMTFEDVFSVYDNLDETQKEAVHSLIALAVQNYSDEENDDMKHNVFEGDNEENSLSHADMVAIIEDAKNRTGSLKKAAENFGANFIAHADGEYGIRNIEYLFPEFRNINQPPDFIKRETKWADTVMAGVHKTPFSRIRSTFADITEDDARALGYIKGNRKKEEVFGLLKRTTTPQTIYKKQKLDRDDIIDITDFDVVSWLKGEMRLMLNEEIARAALFGDGRPVSSEDHISHDHIRPAWLDDDLYTIKATLPAAASADTNEQARQFIRTVIKSRKDYKGSGNPIMFTTEDQLTDLMLMEDKNGRMIYESEDKLRSVLRVSRIITVPIMEGLTREATGGKKMKLDALILNLNDYNIGADKGGSLSMFDQFDIDFNQQKYLIETRCSGALIKPYSCIAIESEVTTAVG